MSSSLSSVTTLLNDRRRDTTSLSLDMTGPGFRAVNGMLQTWNQEHDWPWQIESETFDYNEGIDTYPIPASWDFKAFCDAGIRCSLPAQLRDDLYYVSQGKFDDDAVHPHRFAVELNGQQQYIRCKYRGSKATINAATDPTSNGTWTGAGAISAVAQDQYDSFEQPSSISFSYAGTSGTLTNSTMTAQDLSRYAGRSNVYLNLLLQSVTNFTSVTVKVGSSSSNYVTATATADYLGETPQIGWNRFAFPWTGSVATVGTPDPTQISYVQVTIAYSVSPATVMNCMENVWVSENVPMTVDFYSNSMAIDTSGNKTQVFANASDTSDQPLWSGTWDFVNEPFVNSCMETVAYLTGAAEDEQDAFAKVQQHLEPLKARLPSKRRYPQFQLAPDINGFSGRSPWPYRRYPFYN